MGQLPHAERGPIMFKSIRAYQCHESVQVPDELGDLLQLYAFEPCKPTDMGSAGFVPLSDGLMHYRMQSKILPASEINKRVDAHVAELGRPANRKERQDIKEDVIHAMLPHAFSKFTNVFGYFHDGLLIVDASSASVAETFNATLRGALGSLPVKQWLIGYDTRPLFTDWLLGKDMPPGLSLGSYAVLSGVDKQRVTVKNISLDDARREIETHTAAGLLCEEIHLMLDNVAQFTLREDWSIKSMTPHDAVEFDELVDPDPQQRAVADYYIYREIISAILRTLSGAVNDNAE